MSSCDPIDVNIEETIQQISAVITESPQDINVEIKEGSDGKTILNGVTDPISQGVDGDFYINTSSNFLFGPKYSGSWGAGVSLIGPSGAQGLQGPSGLQGAIGPSGASGAAGPNLVSTGTSTAINGLLKGSGGFVAQAAADVDYATPSAVNTLSGYINTNFYPRSNPSGYLTGMDYIALDSRYVNATGTETIFGQKTFWDSSSFLGTNNTFSNQVPASTVFQDVATQEMAAPFPTFGGPPPRYRIFEDFPAQNGNSSYIGTHGWYLAGTGGGGIANASNMFTNTGPNAYGIIVLVASTNVGAYRQIYLPTNGTQVVNLQMHALFACPNTTGMAFSMGFVGGGSVDLLAFDPGSGGWFLYKAQGASVVSSVLLSGNFSGGDFYTGSKYKISLGRPTDTTTKVHIAIASANGTGYTTLYDGTVTHSSWGGGWGQIQPAMTFTSLSGGAVSGYIDYVAYESTRGR